MHTPIASQTKSEVCDVVIGAEALPGMLQCPAGATGLVIFVHGSGSSRFSPRNAYAAKRLHAHGVATLLFDLLTEAESADRRNVFDIALLTSRTCEAVEWARADERCAGLGIGLFGASTGAASAIRAAAVLPYAVRAVVSRGGRPDLASEQALLNVTAPTLLLVGGWDDGVIDLNQLAYDQLRCEKEMVIVPGATHLFEEPGTLEEVARQAADWFARHLPAGQ